VHLFDVCGSYSIGSVKQLHLALHETAQEHGLAEDAKWLENIIRWCVLICSYIVKLAICKLLGQSIAPYLVPVPLANLRNHPSSATISHASSSPNLHLLVPHVSQNASASGYSLLLPAGSAGGSVIIGWAALHLCDFAEPGGVGLSRVRGG
jgi:hypothetical protein